MFSNIYRLISGFLRKTRTIDNEPLNKVSLIVIILIDIFILLNVFSGLNDISQWYLSPAETYPCYSQWQNYRDRATKDYDIIQAAISHNHHQSWSFEQQYNSKTDRHLGKINDICLDYARLKDALKKPDKEKLTNAIADKTEAIEELEKANQQIQNQYDSTLLEKIAGQPQANSINSVSADRAKQTLTKNQANISEINSEINNLKQQLLAKPESQSLIDLIRNSNKFQIVERKHQRASFWYPSIQLGFQSLFLLPLIVIASIVYRIAQHKRYGLLSLITWHLLVIFSIPLIFKVFEFLQIGIIFKAISSFLEIIFLNLLFLVHYVYILLVPLVGFGTIKLFQKIVFNPKSQAAKRIQKSRCVRCAKKINPTDSYCPHCGYYQYQECPNCHQLTYKFLSYCNHCGHHQVTESNSET